MQLTSEIIMAACSGQMAPVTGVCSPDWILLILSVVGFLVLDFQLFSPVFCLWTLVF